MAGQSNQSRKKNGKRAQELSNSSAKAALRLFARLRNRPACSGLGGKNGREGWGSQSNYEEVGGGASPLRPSFNSQAGTLLAQSSSQNTAAKFPPLRDYCYPREAAATAAANSSGHRLATVAAILPCLKMRMRPLQGAIHYADSQTKQYFLLLLDDTIHSRLPLWIRERGSK